MGTEIGRSNLRIIEEAKLFDISQSFSRHTPTPSSGSKIEGDAMKSTKQLKREHYNRFYRDKRSAKFYRSKLWRDTQEMKLRRDPLCESCKQAGRTTVANVVHHMIPVKSGKYNLNLDYLVSSATAATTRSRVRWRRKGRAMMVPYVSMRSGRSPPGGAHQISGCTFVRYRRA